MTDIRAPEHERQGNGRQAVSLVGREAEVDRIREFLAAARGNGGALFVIDHLHPSAIPGTQLEATGDGYREGG